jgi:hypothetical protein
MGFEPLAPYVFKSANPTHEVEHLLFFQIWGKPLQFLQFDFGLRHLESQEFAYSALLKFGNSKLRQLETNNNLSCQMRFPVEGFIDPEALGHVDVSEIGLDVLSQYITELITQRLWPMTMSVNSAETLLVFLIADYPYAPWFRIDALARFAQIAFLAKAVGYSPVKCRDLLENLSEKSIKAIANEPMDKEEFLTGMLNQLYQHKRVQEQ